MKKLEIQFLQAELNRVSDWIRFADQKSAFLSVYYSAILFFLISQKEIITISLQSFEGWGFCLFILLLVLTIIFFIVGIIFLLCSVFPRLKNHLIDTSLFYFGSIAKKKFLDYSKQMENLSEVESKKQIMEQIYTNSVIANQKMKNVQNSTKSLLILLLGVFILILL